MIKGEEVKIGNGGNKKIVVIYHGDCPDGFSGAWAAWKKFGNRAKYIGVSDRLNPPPGLAGKTAYFIDWVYPLATMKKVQRAAEKVTVIDHHATADAAAKAMGECVFNLKHSGAVLAWKYFHPGKPVPRILKYVEDCDLWRFKIPYAHAVETFLSTLPFTFQSWSYAAGKLDSKQARKKIIEQGRLLDGYQKRLIADIASKAKQVLFEGRKVLAVNSPIFQSELGHYLAMKHPPFAVIWGEKSDGGTRVSLRSVRNFDIAGYAKKYGGGGHKTAAGFTIPAGKKLPWRPIK